MVTMLYAVLGSVLIIALVLGPATDAFLLERWAQSAWVRLRFGSRPFTAPPALLSRRGHAAALGWILALFLGALALPR